MPPSANVNEAIKRFQEMMLLKRFVMTINARRYKKLKKYLNNEFKRNKIPLVLSMDKNKSNMFGKLEVSHIHMNIDKDFPTIINVYSNPYLMPVGVITLATDAEGREKFNRML